MQYASHALFRLGILKQPIQQNQDIPEERICPFVARLHDAHLRHGQVLALTGIAQVIILSGQATGVRPANGCRQVALRQFELGPYCGHLGHRVRSKIQNNSRGS